MVLLPLLSLYTVVYIVARGSLLKHVDHSIPVLGIYQWLPSWLRVNAKVIAVACKVLFDLGSIHSWFHVLLSLPCLLSLSQTPPCCSLSITNTPLPQGFFVIYLECSSHRYRSALLPYFLCDCAKIHLNRKAVPPPLWCIWHMVGAWQMFVRHMKHN